MADNDKVDVQRVARGLFPDYDEQYSKDMLSINHLKGTGRYSDSEYNSHKKDAYNGLQTRARLKQAMKTLKNENKTMKKKVRITESDLHRIVKASVNKVLKESVMRNSLSRYPRRLREGQEDMMWRQWGIDPRSVHQLMSVEYVEIPDSDYGSMGDNYAHPTSRVTDFGIFIDDGVPQIYISNWQEEGEEAAETIRSMCKDLQREDPQSVWNSLAFENWL